MSGDIHALSGAYAVDAVDEFERAQFERHLAQCSTCRAEVASLREGAAEMSGATSAAPPVALRARVLADIATVRPLPPIIARADEARRARRRWPALVAAAAAFIVIGGAGATAWHPWSHQPSVAASELENVLAAPDRITLTHRLDAKGSATVTRSASVGLAVLQAKNLPAPPTGKIYELWLFHDGTPSRAGLISEGGNVDAVLSGDAATADGAAITVENAPTDTPHGPAFAQFSFEPA